MIEKKDKKKPWRAFAGAAIVLSVAAITGQSVLSSLNATAFNTVAQNVNAGTLKLDLANSGNGFGTSISNLVPGDIVNRYVTLTNSGTLDGINLTLKTAQTGTASLYTDGVSPSTTKALRLTINSCSQPWNTGNGSCGGTTATEIAAAPLDSYGVAKSFASASMNSGAVKYLQVQLQLPDQNETTVNGVLPANTVQGGIVGITYTFDFAQRVATTTNS